MRQSRQIGMGRCKMNPAVSFRWFFCGNEEVSLERHTENPPGFVFCSVFLLQKASISLHHAALFLHKISVLQKLQKLQMNETVCGEQ